MSLLNYWKTRGLLGLGAIAALAVGTYGASALGIPAPGVIHASLLLQPSPVSATLIAGVLLLISVIAGTLIAGQVRPDAGIFCGVFALLAISWHAGSLRDVLFAQPQPSVYTLLAVECGLLTAMLGVLQFIVRLLVSREVLRGDQGRDGIEAPSASIGEIILAILVTAGAYVLLSWFLLPTDAKQQALLGLAVAGFLSAALVHQVIVPTAPAWPFWIGVMIGATASFAYAATAPGIPTIGFVAIPPARALPLDHASAGVASSILGYWYSRRWKRAGDAENLAAIAE